MNVRALFFAAYRDVAGASELRVDLPPGSSVADLLVSLRSRGGAWLRMPTTPAVAVNMEYAPLDRSLSDGDEVAFIPPVSGGRK